MTAIIDSITKQEIQDDEPVVLILLLNATSQSNDMGLMARSSERLKMASLPIHGVWGDDGFIVNDNESIAVTSALKSFDIEYSDFEELLSSLWSDSTITVDRPSWNCSNKQEYSIFVTKESSLEKVANTSVVRKTVGIHDVNADIQQMTVFASKFATADAEYKSNKYQCKDYFDAQCNMEAFENILNMTHSGNSASEDGDRVPYASSALKRNGETPFATELLITLKGDEYNVVSCRDFGSKEFIENPVFPDFYQELFRSVHEGISIMHSLNLLDIPLSPTFFAGAGFRDTSKMELMGQVLAEDIRSHVEECRSYSDDPLREIDTLIAPIKSCVADAIRERNSLPGFNR